MRDNMERDHYEVLGLERNANDALIKRTYRKLVLRHHPDCNPNSAVSRSRFLDIQAAYEILSDPSKRASYDRLTEPENDDIPHKPKSQPADNLEQSSDDKESMRWYHHLIWHLVCLLFLFPFWGSVALATPRPFSFDDLISGCILVSIGAVAFYRWATTMAKTIKRQFRWLLLLLAPFAIIVIAVLGGWNDGRAAFMSALLLVGVVMEYREILTKSGQ